MMIVANINNMPNSLVRPEKSEYRKKIEARVSNAIEAKKQIPTSITKEDLEDW